MDPTAMPKGNGKKSGRKLTLYVLRHGEAGSHVDDHEKDAARPLTRLGRKETVDVAKCIKKLGLRFDLVASSPLRRARETVQITAKTLGKRTQDIEEWNELKPASDTDALFSRLVGLKGKRRVLLVGHEPFLSGMIAEIVSGKPGARIALKKGGIAKVKVDEIKPRISGELAWLLTPKLLKKLSR